MVTTSPTVSLVNHANPVMTAEQMKKADESIKTNLENAKSWKETAKTVVQYALMAMAVVAAATVAFYASPIIPFMLVIGGLFCAFIAVIACGTKAPSTGDQQMDNAIIGDVLKASAWLGIQWSKLIYTAPVGIAVGIGNAATAALALPVAGVAGLGILYENRKIQHYENLEKDLNKVRSEAGATDSIMADARQELLKLGAIKV